MFVVWVHEAHFTFAVERTWGIEAVAIVAEGNVVGTFVDVDAVVTIAFEAGIALALEGAFGVDALSVLIAAAVVG